MRRLVLILALLAMTGCACRSTWFRSCGLPYQTWGVRSEIAGGVMVVWVERLPTGTWTIEARRNTPDGQRVLAWAAVSVTGEPDSVRVTLEPIEWAPVPPDAFIVIRRLGD